MRKRVLITGASYGIGEELARVYAKNNYDLVLIARSNDKLDALKNELESLYDDIDVRVICIDLSQVDGANKLYDAISHLRIDVLINNAGVGSFGEFYKSDLKRQQELIVLNILSLAKLTHLFIGPMVERNEGTIINIASTASFQPGPLMANYYASKAYVLSFTEALAAEMKWTGVKILAYCPGPTRTSFLTNANVKKEKALTSKVMARPREVAEDVYKTMNTNKTLRVASGKFRWALFMERFIPRKVTSDIVFRIQEKRKE